MHTDAIFLNSATKASFIILLFRKCCPPPNQNIIHYTLMAGYNSKHLEITRNILAFLNILPIKPEFYSVILRLR